MELRIVLVITAEVTLGGLKDYFSVLKSEMSAEAAVNLLQLFDSAGIDVWLDGGWAVDAALGEQTRSHKDLDIILQVSDLDQLRTILADRGFRVREGGTESNFVLVDGSRS